MKYIVYCTTCTKNGKIYIGVHKTETPEVFDGYIGNGICVGYSLHNPKTAYQYALKKYGYSSFKRSILYIFNTEKEAYDKEAEIVNIDFIKRKDNYNTSLGGIHSGTVYDSLFQYTVDGKFIKEWISVQSAVEYFKCNSNRFNMCITDKRSAFNSFWTKKYYEHLDITDYKISKHDYIYQYDLKGNLIKIYNSELDILNEHSNYTKSSLCDAVSHKRPLGQYYFVHSDINIIDVIKRRQLVFNISDHCISKYRNGKLLFIYPSIKKAALENNTTTTEIKNSMKNKEKIWSYGYSDIYIEQYNPVTTQIEQYDLQGNLVKIWESMAQCAKEHPKFKEVMAGARNQTHGYTFKIHKLKIQSNLTGDSKHNG